MAAQKIFSYFLSQLELSSIHLCTAGFQLSAATGKAEHGNGPFETKIKDCHSQTTSYFLLNTNTLFEVIHLAFSKGTLCNLASGDL